MAKGGRSALMSIRKKCKEDGVAPWTVVDRTGKRPSWYTPKEEGAGVEIVTDRGDGKKKALTKEGKKLCADGRDEAFFVRFFEQNDQVMDQANNVHRKSLKCLEAKGGSTKSVDLMVCPTFELLKTRQTEELDGIEPQRDWIRIKDDGEASCVGNQIQLSEEEITKKENMANQEDDYTKPCNSGWMTRHPGSECEFADKKSGEKWKGICLENWTRSKLELTSAEPSSTRERFWNGRGRTRYARCECGNLEQWREETKKMMGKAAATAEPGSGG
ncbi:unnamed protein product [Amoebophrya sp. A25]|nr:unnamed protein product [Amoebophrya sp. A25]|eukprot:GSA25T00012702001.1